MTTFAGLFEVVDGVEALRTNVTQLRSKFYVKVKVTITNIQLDRHNRVFVCRATNLNGNESVQTTIQVFGELTYTIIHTVCVCVSCAGVPDQIDHNRIETTPISLVSMSVRFPTPIDNNALITGYMYMLCQGTCTNSPTPGTARDYQIERGHTMFNIGDLVPNSVYILRVAALSKVGDGLTPTDDTDAHTFNSSTSGV